MGLDVAEISELAADPDGREQRPGHGSAGGRRWCSRRRHGMRHTEGKSCAIGHGKRRGGGRRCRRHRLRAPKASGSMGMLPIAPLQQDDGVDVGFATPLATGGVIGPLDGCAAAGDENSFTTLTTADSTLLPATVCPPAPRKSAPAPTRKRAPLQQRLFYPVPSDLTTVFLAVPQCPPPAKKMRAHAAESSAPLGT